jgi:hypothetical protein
VFEGGKCDRPGARTGAVRSDSTIGQVESYTGTLLTAGSGLLPVAYLLMMAALVMQCRWLAVAYRGVPRGRRRHRPGQAYSPLVIALVWPPTLFIVSLLTLAFAGEAAVLPLFWALLIGIVVFSISMLAAQLRWISMLGQVNHTFGRHDLPARLMRSCLIGWLLLAFGGGWVLLEVASLLEGDWAWLRSTLEWVVVVLFYGLPITGLIAFVVAVVLATVEIDRTLTRAGGELTRLEGAGWLAVDPRPHKL